MIAPVPGLRFHHVGVACEDIAAEAAKLAALGYVEESAPFEDPRQGVRGVFLGGQSPRLELLQALDAAGDGGVLGPWLRQGVKLYHLAYETDDIAVGIESLRSRRAKVAVPPVPAVAFGGREIAFLMMPNRLLIELIASETS